MSDMTIHSGSVPIATRDHGGDGPPVLLLHGGGGNLLGWRDFPNRLTPAHRVVSFDLRGHGHSGDGDWDTASLLADIRAVADHFGFDEPALVGHSLGGMLSALWARDNPGCPAAVSIDGHRSAATHEHNYDGLDPETLRADLKAITEVFDAQTAALERPVPPEQLEAMRAMRSPDEGEAVFEARLQRDLVERDGQTYSRLGADTARLLRVMPEFVDAVPVLNDVAVPFLMLLATRDFPGLPPQFGPLMAAHRAGLRRDLATVRQTRPNLEVTEVDGSHGMVSERPDEVAALVLDFLARDRN
ncbi:alpha/beta hydrolase fold protein [Stackebrandtia nassauensis DSM 44728]|uniref:Alpha/beta hydrolase fold protein n=2 Tax=Stackebrandtia TaxID=283810 RepID=D3PY92_STANL|nr:alpha/beta hydrolase fold protein [Stackebrandtia nassauensis DSM 44728]